MTDAMALKGGGGGVIWSGEIWAYLHPFKCPWLDCPPLQHIFRLISTFKYKTALNCLIQYNTIVLSKAKFHWKDPIQANTTVHTIFPFISPSHTSIY